MSELFDLTHADDRSRSEAIAHAVEALRDELLVVLPTDTVYGLAADAFSPDAVSQLLETKGRGREMPPPVLLPEASTVEGVATDIPDGARQLMMKFWPGPLTLVLWAQPTLRWDLGDTEGTVAVRVPQHDVALELLAQSGPLAVSSANRTGYPAAQTATEAQHVFDRQVACYVESGPCSGSLPSTIVDFTRDVPQVLRPGAVSWDDLCDVVPTLLDEDGRERGAEAEREEPIEDSSNTHVPTSEAMPGEVSRDATPLPPPGSTGTSAG